MKKPSKMTPPPEPFSTTRRSHWPLWMRIGVSALCAALTLTTQAIFAPPAAASPYLTAVGKVKTCVEIPDAEDPTFADVPGDHTFNEDVEFVNAIGVMNGVSSGKDGHYFAPAAPLTVAQAAVIASRLKGRVMTTVFRRSGEAARDLVSAQSEAWYTSAARTLMTVHSMVTLEELGFSKVGSEEREQSYSDSWLPAGEQGRYAVVPYDLYRLDDPNEATTRGQYALFLWVLNGCPENADPDSDDALPTVSIRRSSGIVNDSPVEFTDLGEMPKNMSKAAKWLASLGVGGYSDGSFGPDRPLTRGAAARIAGYVYSSQTGMRPWRTSTIDPLMREIMNQQAAETEAAA